MSLNAKSHTIDVISSEKKKHEHTKYGFNHVSKSILYTHKFNNLTV